MLVLCRIFFFPSYEFFILTSYMSAYVLAKVGAISFDRSPSLQNQKSKQTKATNYTVADLEGKGASRLAPPPNLWATD